jgi:hypothetical protein
MYLTKQKQERIRYALAYCLKTKDLVDLENVADAAGIEWHEVLKTVELIELWDSIREKDIERLADQYD